MPTQMLAYQLGWMDLLLGWKRDKQAGCEVITPTPGYRWNRLGDLYSTFYGQWYDASPPQLQQAFRERGDSVIALVASPSQEELFDSGQRTQASSTPSAWPMAKWAHVNTMALFASFRTRIRAQKRGQTLPPLIRTGLRDGDAPGRKPRASAR